jgi:hypothetical protein
LRTFKHNGNLGDIIYSLPTIIALGGGVLYISNERNNIGIKGRASKPRPMTVDGLSQIIDLLKLQPYLHDVRLYKNEKVDFNLNKFREYILDEPQASIKWRHHLSRWHLKAFGVKFNLALPWIQNIASIYAGDIVIGRCTRYISKENKFNWKILKDYENQCVFVGFKDEYIKFIECTELNIKRYPINTILEFAQIIKGSKLYIGNQSLGFALAEAMKHPRVLEVCYQQANCMPQSSNGHIRLNKKLIEKYLKDEDEHEINQTMDKAIVGIRNFLFHQLIRSRIILISQFKHIVKSSARKARKILEGFR